METDELWTNQTEWHVVQHGPLALCQDKRSVRTEEIERASDRAFDTYCDEPQPLVA